LAVILMIRSFFARVQYRANHRAAPCWLHYQCSSSCAPCFTLGIAVAQHARDQRRPLALILNREAIRRRRLLPANEAAVQRRSQSGQPESFCPLQSLQHQPRTSAISRADSCPSRPCPSKVSAPLARFSHSFISAGPLCSPDAVGGRSFA
jgi:hypothetical protein